MCLQPGPRGQQGSTLRTTSQASESMSTRPFTPGPRTPTPPGNRALRACEKPWFPLVRLAITPLFLKGGYGSLV